MAQHIASSNHDLSWGVVSSATIDQNLFMRNGVAFGVLEDEVDLAGPVLGAVNDDRHKIELHVVDE